MKTKEIIQITISQCFCWVLWTCNLICRSTWATRIKASSQMNGESHRIKVLPLSCSSFQLFASNFKYLLALPKQSRQFECSERRLVLCATSEISFECEMRETKISNGKTSSASRRHLLAVRGERRRAVEAEGSLFMYIFVESTWKEQEYGALWQHRVWVQQ